MDQSLVLTPYNFVLPMDKEEGSWGAWTFMYRPLRDELLHRRGQLFALLSLANIENGMDGQRISKEIFDKLQQEYFGEKAGGVLEALEHAAHGCLQHGQELLRGRSTRVELIAVAVWGKGFYYFRTPNTYLGQVQNDELLDLDQHQLGSEVLRDKDKLLLATPVVARRLLIPFFREQEDQSNFEEEILVLKEKFYHLETAAPRAAVVINVALEEVPSEEEVIEIEVAEEYSRNSWMNERFPLLRRAPIQSVRGFLSSSSRRILQRRYFFLVKGLIQRIRAKREKPEIYLKPRFPQSKKGRVVVVVFLVGLLGASVWVTRKINEKRRREQEAWQLINLSREHLQKAQEFSALDPLRAQQQLQVAWDTLGRVLGANDKVSQEAQGLKEKINTVSRNLYRTQTREAKKVTDASLLNQLNKQSLIVNHSRGVANRRGEVLLNADTDWQVPVAVEEYLGNLYILDPGKNQIHKYLSFPGGYRPRHDYFREKVDLSGAVDLSIDGSIYVLYRQGRVLKFTLGKQEEFSLDEFHPSWQEVKIVGTSPEAKDLYLVSDDGVMVFGKDGEYRYQLKVTHLGSIEDLVVSASDTETKLWFYTQQGEWYEVGLRDQ